MRRRPSLVMLSRVTNDAVLAQDKLPSARKNCARCKIYRRLRGTRFPYTVLQSSLSCRSYSTITPKYIMASLQECMKGGIPPPPLQKAAVHVYARDRSIVVLPAQVEGG